MEPAFKNGDKVLAISYVFSSPSIGDVIVIKQSSNTLAKRIVKIKNKKYFVEGDNKKESTDSRNFGLINKKDIIGKVVLKI